MTRYAAVFLFCWALAFAQPIVFEHVTVIPATGGPPIKDVSVGVVQDRIAVIQTKLTPPAGAKIVNGKGKFLIPGLWDMHVHITDPAQFFPLFLAAGVTGVREMYSGIAASEAVQWRKRPDAPLIALPGFLDGPMMLSNGPPPPGALAVATAQDGAIAVQIMARSGADFLKVYSSIPREAYFAIADAARAIDMPFAGHVPEAVSPLEAAMAGQRSQEHLLNILLACSTQEEQLRAERVAVMTSNTISPRERTRLLGFPRPEGLFDTYSEEKAQTLFRAFVDHGTWQTPTLSILQGFGYGDALVRDPRSKLMPAEWRKTAHPRDKDYMNDLSPADYKALVTRIRALIDRYKKLVSDMRQAGVRFLAGTDVSIANPVLIGFGVHDELRLLVESGLTPMEALQTATINPAIYFGQQTQMGTVEVGKVANLVLLDADPLKDIRNVGKIRGVVLRGRYLDRTELDRMTGVRRR